MGSKIALVISLIWIFACCVITRLMVVQYCHELPIIVSVLIFAVLAVTMVVSMVIAYFASKS